MRRGDMDLHRCVRCGNFWNSNVFQGSSVLTQLCPDCVAALPTLPPHYRDHPQLPWPDETEQHHHGNRWTKEATG